MERRTRGQLSAIDEYDVGPATLGEVVRDRGPADAAADDDGPRVFHPRRVAAAIPSRGATDHRAGHRGDPRLGGAKRDRRADPGRADEHELPGRGGWHALLRADSRS